VGGTFAGYFTKLCLAEHLTGREIRYGNWERWGRNAYRFTRNRGNVRGKGFAQNLKTWSMTEAAPIAAAFFCHIPLQSYVFIIGEMFVKFIFNMPVYRYG
jgi:hypothetical protein